MRRQSHQEANARRSQSPFQYWRFLAASVIVPTRHPAGPLIAQGIGHHAKQKENAMDFGLIFIATNTLVAILLFYVLNLIWKQ